MRTIDELKTIVMEYAAANPDITVTTEVQDEGKLLEVTIEDPDDEYVWVGRAYNLEGKVMMEDQSDDCDPDESDALVDYLDELTGLMS